MSPALGLPSYEDTDISIDLEAAGINKMLLTCCLRLEEIAQGNSQSFGDPLQRIQGDVGWGFAFNRLKVLVVQTGLLCQLLLREAASSAKVPDAFRKSMASFASHVARILSEHSPPGHPA